MNGKQVWISKKVAVAYFKVLSWHFPGDSEENHEKSHAGYMASQADTSQIQVWNITTT